MRKSLGGLTYLWVGLWLFESQVNLIISGTDLVHFKPGPGMGIENKQLEEWRESRGEGS